MCTCLYNYEHGFKSMVIRTWFWVKKVKCIRLYANSYRWMIICKWLYANSYRWMIICKWLYANGYRWMIICKWLYPNGYRWMIICKWLYANGYMRIVICEWRPTYYTSIGLVYVYVRHNQCHQGTNTHLPQSPFGNIPIYTQT